MSTAGPLPDNIRRIAVLVSSVDSATARQLLLHLPTSIAKQVRHALQNLGPVNPAERQRILAEFQSTAARQNQPPAPSPSSAAPLSTAPSSTTGQQSANYTTSNPSSFAAPGYPHVSSNPNEHHYNSQAYAPSLAEHSERGGSPLYATPQDAMDVSQPSWKRMDIRALSHFLRAERATVIAVVINQLPPDKGVALLQQLPTAMHREVLQAIANLQDIDEEAMQSIEEHLAERIKDYEQQVNGEAKGTRRVAALLAAAPPELQESWSRFVHLAIDPATETTPAQEPRVSVQATAQVAGASPLNTQPESIQSLPIKPPSVAKPVTVAVPSNPSVVSEDLLPDDGPRILPFPGPDDLQPLSNTDRSLIQIEFEQILSLSTQQLAQVLSAAESQTVLLALAGASPSFMKRFYSMLTKPDSKALASRLSKIGPLKLRDIDEAQRTIAELADKLTSSRSIRSSHIQPLRVAA
ncbi:MAG: FliG C-terminal domain-containing protein [Pirellulaceae bacterium]|nr:FliG C-terminal domain-containing protein [Pirellulaceae bacterium]